MQENTKQLLIQILNNKIMSINKNKSEIVESFKNLLKKAEEEKGLHKEKI